MSSTRRILLSACFIAASCTGTEGFVAPPVVLLDGSPMTGNYLNRKQPGPRGDGLLVAPDGPGGPAPDALELIEARAYYASVDALDATTGVPAAWGDWLAAFGFPGAQPGEARPSYRARTGAVVFYNQYETGLGHELGCRPFAAPLVGGGAPAQGVACFLVNYGTWRDPERSLRDAREGVGRLSAFGITYRPDFKPEGADGYEVQFYAYDADGRRLDWAQLDTMGPRPLPEVCLGCHGGSYDRERHLVRYARFLPLHVANLTFTARDDTPGDSRQGQEPVAHALNALIARTPLTPRQRAALGGAAGGDRGQAPPGYDGAIPEGWRGGPEREDLYERVISPFCSTCHDAEMRDATGGEKPIYARFESYDAFLDSSSPSSLCGSFSMPNTQAGLTRFWATSDEGVTLRDAGGVPRRYAPPADALLAAFGRSRSMCEGLAQASDCRTRGASVCGDLASGIRCDEAGMCEPPGRVQFSGQLREVTPPRQVEKEARAGCPSTTGSLGSRRDGDGLLGTTRKRRGEGSADPSRWAHGGRAETEYPPGRIGPRAHRWRARRARSRPKETRSWSRSTSSCPGGCPSAARSLLWGEGFSRHPVAFLRVIGSGAWR